MGDTVSTACPTLSWAPWTGPVRATKPRGDSREEGELGEARAARVSHLSAWTLNPISPGDSRPLGDVCSHHHLESGAPIWEVSATQGQRPGRDFPGATPRGPQGDQAGESPGAWVVLPTRWASFVPGSCWQPFLGNLIRQPLPGDIHKMASGWARRDGERVHKMVLETGRTQTAHSPPLAQTWAHTRCTPLTPETHTQTHMLTPIL